MGRERERERERERGRERERERESEREREEMDRGRESTVPKIIPLPSLVPWPRVYGSIHVLIKIMVVEAGTIFL